MIQRFYFYLFISQDAFVLLDLLGAKDPTFYNWFPTTSRLYESLKRIGLFTIEGKAVFILF